MNNEQIEKAARKLCELRGVDPESRCADPENTTMAYVVIPAWQVAAFEIRQRLMMDEAIRHGIG